ncbi:hypothetical protein BDV12DRAFT_207080 [Aspergillus spectabilis]
MAQPRSWRVGPGWAGLNLPFFPCAIHNKDDSILVNLAEYRHIHINPASQTVIATSSVTSKELNDTLAPHALFFPGRHCPDVGLGGFLLQGGMGWNCANWGWACEYLLGIDVITAAGKRIHCNNTQNRDLFWAARGAGPAFPAIVTKFHLQAMPCPRVIRPSGYIFPRSQYRSAFSWALALVAGLDKDTEITAKGHYYDHGQVSEPCFSVFVTCFKDNIAEATRAFLPIQESRLAGTLTGWFCVPESMDSLYSVQARSNPRSHRYTTDSGFLGGPESQDVDIVSALAEPFTTLPHRKPFAFWTPMRPWSQRVLADMVPSLQADHYFAVYTKVEGCVGSYIGDSEFEGRMARYWDTERMERVMGIRRRWDPNGGIAGGYPRGGSIRIITTQGQE